MACLRFGVLGPLEVWRHQQPVEITAGRQRTVLAMLVLRNGSVVSTEQLVAAVWDEHPPATARRTLQSLVSRLRRALRCCGESPLTQHPSGYRLAVALGKVDAYRFTQLVHQSGEADRQGQVEQVAAGLRHALELWRGPALADVPRTAIVEAEAVRLEEQRYAAVEARIDAQLRLGRHTELLGDLHTLTTTQPLQERAWELLLLALYRSGRRADALAAYQRVRTILNAELGVEPGSTLQELHRRVLAADPALTASAGPEPGSAPPTSEVSPISDPSAAAHPPVRPTPPAAEPGPAAKLPRQLPPDVAGFAGRGADLTRLDALLSDRPGQPLRVLAIDGPPGVGKTALAVHWAHRVKHRFPDGQIFVNLRGYAPDPPLSAAEVLVRFLAAFGVPAATIPADLDEAAAMYRSLLAGRRVLVVLDNAAGPDQVRPLLPGDEGCAVLVTGRDQLDWLVAREGAHRLKLGVLAPADAQDLLTELIGPARAAAEPGSVSALADLCGHLPLALRIAAADLSAHPQRPISAQVGQLRHSDRVSALAVNGDPQGGVAAAFDLSYRRLAEPARRLFRLLGLVPGVDVSVEAAAALAGSTPAQVQQPLRALATACLIDEHAPGRYTVHDLLREYAASRLDAEESSTERHAALTRIFAQYLHRASAAVAELAPHRLLLVPPDPATPAPVPASLADAAAASAWLDAEAANLVAAVQYAARHGHHRWAWTLADTVGFYCGLRHLAAPWEATARAGLAAAEVAGDERAQVAGHLSLAALTWRLTRYRDSADHAGTARRLAQRTGWAEAQAAALNHVAVVHARTGDFAAALAHARRGLVLSERAGWRRGQAIALTNLGSMYVEMGWPVRAVPKIRQALELAVTLGTRPSEVVNLVNLGAAHYVTGEFEPACAALERALELGHAIGSSGGVCTAQRWLALLHLTTGRYDRAEELAAASAARAREHELDLFEADARVALATVRYEQGRYEEAISEGRRALSIAEGASAVLTPVEVWINLATIYLKLGEPQRALRYALWALGTARELGLHLLEGQALTALAGAHLADGRVGRALGCGVRAYGIHREVGYRLGQARTDLLLGRARRELGDTALARRHWQRAEGVLSALGTPDAGTAAGLLAALRVPAARSAAADRRPAPASEAEQGRSGSAGGGVHQLG